MSKVISTDITDSAINVHTTALNLDMESLVKKKTEGTDGSYITGDGDNRFLCCDFENGKLDFKTAHIVSPADSFREETVQWLRDNYQYVEYSILTESQRQKIKDDITF